MLENNAILTKKASVYDLIDWRELLWPVTDSNDNIAALDGLRAMAALLVLSFHILLSVQDQVETNTNNKVGWLDATNTFWSYGSSGVQLFFVLSGFLLFLPYARTLLGLKRFPSTRKFYTKRALRILPAYWVSLFLIVFCTVQNFLPLPKPNVITANYPQDIMG